MRKGFVVAGLLACIVCAPAEADWQYTRWGMTAPKVVEGSGGKVALVDPKSDATMPFGVKAAAGTYDAGGRPMKASFWFKNAKLSQVDLSSDDQDACYAIRRDLSGVYGPAAMIDGNTWADKAKGNRVHFVDWASLGCQLIYSPLSTPQNTGL